MPSPDGYISQEDYIAWLHHPVTKVITDARYGDILRTQEFMGRGGTLDATDINITALNTAFNVGYIKGLREAVDPPAYLEMSIVDDTHDEDDEED
jgi:hypothetical protein